MSSESVDAAAGEVDRYRAPVPKLRFPEFRDAGEWKSERLGELIRTLTPPKRLPTSLYAASGDYPIVDQSQDLICGWTNDKDAVIEQAGSAIIFGDHTCTLKLVRFPFAQGADGIKILTAKSGIFIGFLYQSLLHNPLVMEDYRRHFSIFRDRIVSFPDIESGEQQKIADCLSSLDAVIAAEGDRLAVLRDHKKGLMQALFPTDDRTTPRLRFPEFRDAGEWEQLSLQKALAGPATYGIVKAGDYQPTGVRMVRGGDIKGGIINKDLPLVANTVHQEYRRTILRTNDVLIALVGYPGEAAVVPEELAGSNISRAVGLLRPSERVIPGFLASYLNSDKGRRDVLAPSAGSAQVVVNLAALNKLRLLLPKPAEQHRIADLLAALDAAINEQLNRRAWLKVYKSGLMQQLFPLSARTSV